MLLVNQLLTYSLKVDNYLLTHVTTHALPLKELSRYYAIPDISNVLHKNTGASIYFIFTIKAGALVRKIGKAGKLVSKNL